MTATVTDLATARAWKQARQRAALDHTCDWCRTLYLIKSGGAARGVRWQLTEAEARGRLMDPFAVY